MPPSIIDHFEELQADNLSFTKIAAPPMTLAAETNVSDAFDQFQTEDQELALVLHGGGIIGLLTATDAPKAVMGVSENSLDQQVST